MLKAYNVYITFVLNVCFILWKHTKRRMKKQEVKLLSIPDCRFMQPIVVQVILQSDTPTRFDLSADC